MLFRMGCFRVVERKFWSLSVTAPAAIHPTYLTQSLHRLDRTGHAEVVQMVYDPKQISLQAFLKVFWENTTRPRAGAKVMAHVPSIVPPS